MAKRTVKDLLAIKAQFEHDLSALTENVENLQKQLSDAKKNREQAANDGNVDLYKKYSESIADIEARLYIAQKQVEKARNPFSLDDVREAWSEYIPDFNKAQKKRIEAFQDAKDKLLKQYRELLDYQNEALTVRKTCADLANLEVGSIMADSAFMNAGFKDMAFIPATNNPVKSAMVNYVRNDWTEDDVWYFANRVGRDPNERDSLVQLIQAVSISHRPN